MPERVGSSSARIFAELVQTGGEAVDVSFLWGTDPNNLSNETNATLVSQTGETSGFLSELSPGTTYFRSKAVNGAGESSGEAISESPYFHWELNDTNPIAEDSYGRVNGDVYGAVSVTDPDKGAVLSFDGEDDYINME